MRTPVWKKGIISVAVWDGISNGKRTPVVTIRENINAARYHDYILMPYVVSFLQASHSFTSQQDNADSRTACVTTAFLNANNVKSPVKSPDMNLLNIYGIR